MILKLIPGQKVQFSVHGVEVVQGNFGPQIKFTGVTPDDANATLFLNEDTARRQLERIGYSVDTIVALPPVTVEIERVEKNGTKYTNINRVGASSVASVAAGTRQPVGSLAKQGFSAGPHIPAIDGEHPALPHEKLDQLFRVYDVCMGHALAVAKQMDAAQIGSSPESTAAIAATLLIAAQRAGV